GVVGIGLVFWNELATVELSGGPLLGMVYSVLGSAFASYGNMISIRHQKLSLPIAGTNAFAMGYGSILTCLMSLLSGKSFTFDFHLPYIGSLMYLSLFGSVIVFGLYMKLLGKI